MDLSFIIVNYKSFKYLNNCLKSIKERARGIDYEVIIVNNDEEKIGKIDCIDEDCIERIDFDPKKNKLYDFKLGKKLKIVEINKNIGFGKANNTGIWVSSGKYVCFLNPDTELLTNSIKKVLDEFKNNSKVGVIGPKIIQKYDLSKKEVVQEWSAGGELNVVELIKGKFGFSKSKAIWNSASKLEVDWVTGASMFIEKRLFFKLGGFDENFFLYYEDVDLCKRVRNLGKKVIYYPDFQVLHLGGKSARGQLNQKVEYFKSQDFYYKKWFSKKSYFILRLLRFFYIWRYKI